jgi:hypothetical protein
MKKNQVSLSQIMFFVMIMAVNMALMRAPFWEAGFAGHWFALAVVDFIVVWKAVLRRPFRAFHYVLLIAFVVGFVVLANNVAQGRLQIFGGYWTAGFLALLVAYAASLLASWLERSRGWDIAAFIRGALLGLVGASLIAVGERAIVGPLATPIAGGWLDAVIAIVGGGLIGLAKLRSKGLGTVGDVPRCR